jgi:predicted ribosome quality control (RQC) complex YloA/Tae2 family protein
MEPKRELTSVDIAALTGELQDYRGAGLEKAYLYPEDMLRLKLRHFDYGRLELLCAVGETKHVRLADPERVPAAPDRPPNFAMMLRNRLEGAELAAVSQFEFDRILELTFERSDGSTTIVIELFGDGNIAVLDTHGDVVDCLETVRLKSRTVAPGSTYEYPSSRVNPLTVDREAFGALMEESDTDLVRTLATQLNFGGLYGEELCTRAGVEKARSIDEATEADYDALYETIDRLADRLSRGDLDPRLYFERTETETEPDADETVGPDPDAPGQPVDVTPIPLEERADLAPVAYDRFTEALDDYVHALETTAEAEAEAAGSEAPDFEAQIAKQERIIEQQGQAIEDFEAEAEAEREKAEALYAHYDLVDEILSTVRAARADGIPWDDIGERFAAGAEQGIDAAAAVTAVDGSEGTVTVALGEHDVTLDTTTGVEKNADRLYTEAKRIEEKKAGAEAALEDTRAELEAIRERREAWTAEEEAADEAAAAEDDDEAVDWLARSSIPVRSSEPWYDRFRWVHTSDGFLVIGGRDADQNEDLVKKYLEPGDRFFHAQAHGGPVTVLKATDPSESAGDGVEIPARSHEEAARFAVSYSSVWKEGKFAGDVYAVSPDQVSKTPESGEYLEKGGFAIRGDRTYYDDVAVGVAVGITCEPETRVIGGPPEPVRQRAETSIELEPGRYAQNDVAKRCYREFRERFADESFVRKVASPDRIQEFLPPGGSRILE